MQRLYVQIIGYPNGIGVITIFGVWHRRKKKAYPSGKGKIPENKLINI